MNTPIVNALGAALFHFLWEGAALALMLAVALLIFRQAQARYVAACAVLLAMPVAFVVTLALLYPHTLTFSNLVLLPEQASLTASSPATVTPANGFQDYMRWFVPVWFAGIALFYLRSLGSWIGVVRLRRVGVSAATPEWQKRVAELASRLRVNSVVTLFESRLVDVPVVAGFLRPVILMPAGFLAGMPPEQLEYLLIHELAHVRRLDYFVNLLQKAVEGLLFYHPAVWWVSSVIAKERENCCDDVVLSIHPEPGRYASTLAALEQSRWSAVPAASGGNLSQRIRRILKRPERSHVAHTPVLATVLLGISVAFVFAALQNPAPAAQAQTASTPWEKWVKEDVVYIIQDDERRAFNNLTTDEEREKFVEQFWLRRDPTPGTAENEFKEEHYRRINFVNSRFASPTMPGWKTDRGRIYISFGPPEEIDSHTSCSASTPAYDEWRYRWIEGIGNNVLLRFQDESCTGEYRMTMDPAVAK
jgi:GWxTD domain-containing protein